MTPETPHPPYPHSLPQSGWTTEGPWCAALQMQKKEFLLLLKNFGVPHIPFGRSVLNDVSRFYQHMSGWLDEQGTKRVESRIHAGPQSVTHASSQTGTTFTTLTKKTSGRNSAMQYAAGRTSGTKGTASKSSVFGRFIAALETLGD